MTLPNPTLRFVTYLAPSIPRAFYRALADRVGELLGVGAALEVDTRRSGPQPDADPFSRNCADVGFMCAPCYTDLRDDPNHPVELLAAPVYTDPRNDGRPVYFSEVVVRADATYRAFEEAAVHARWAYNDKGSLSGYHSIARRVRELGLDADPLARAVHSGSHLDSLELVARGEVDAAAIDANVLAIRLAAASEAFNGLRILSTLGPHPVQPVVVRRALAPELKARLRVALLALHTDASDAALLRAYRIERFVPVDDGDYARPPTPQAG